MTGITQCEVLAPKGKNGVAGVYCNGESRLAASLITNIVELRQKSAFFASAWWARNTHVNTIGGHLLRTSHGHPGPGYDRTFISTEDGGTLSLDVSHVDEKRESKDGEPFVLMVAGLGGSSTDPYTKAMAAACTNKGWRSAVLCMRGTGDGPVTSPRLFSARRGSTDDVRHAITHLRESGHVKEGTPIVGVGWSLVGCIMSNTVLEQSERRLPAAQRVSAAAILGAPFDLKDSAVTLQRFPNNFYDTRMGKGLLTFGLPLLAKFGTRFKNYVGDVLEVDEAKLRGCRRVKDFDEHLTAPFFGHASADAYYEYASTTSRWSSVGPDCPALIISALDDPIVGKKGIPFEAARKDPNMMVVATDHGGHLGWVESRRAGCGYAIELDKATWTERVVLSFFETALEHAKTAPAPKGSESAV